MDGGIYEGYMVISLWIGGAIRRVTRSYSYGLGEQYEGLQGHIPMDGGIYEGYTVIFQWMAEL